MKVGIVGKGVMDAVGVAVGTDVLVFAGIGEGVAVAVCVMITGATVTEGAQAVNSKRLAGSLIKNCFKVFIDARPKTFFLFGKKFFGS